MAAAQARREQIATETAEVNALEDRLDTLRAELDVDVCIVNGENIADGVGITPKLADRLLAAGADAITLGNQFELSEYSRDDLIYTKDMLLAPPMKEMPVADRDLFEGRRPGAAQARD